MIMFLTGVIIVSMHTSYAKQMKSVEPENAGSGHAQNIISGEILETMNSGGYTYVLLEKNGKKKWVAVREMKVAVGQEISFAPGYEMTGFKSKTLNRTFDKIIFSTGPVFGQTLLRSHKPAKESSEQMSTGSKGAVGPFSETVKVEKASELNAYTVAELYKKGYSLDNKSVIIRGKVVKVSVGIMGKNWLHIQDGTGDQEKNTYDLVVTTQDEPAVGDVVTLYGTLYKDKDFGSGYKYSVIVEEAIIKKE